MQSRTGILLILGMLISLPAFAQTDQDDTTADTQTADQTQMALPPPVSGMPYATDVGAEARQNYMRIGLTTGGGYVRNLDPRGGAIGQNVNETMYLIEPDFQMNRSSTRFQSRIVYRPSFSWYQVPKVVSTTDQSVLANATYRVSQHVTFLAGEDFEKSTTAFGQITPTFQPTVGGAAQFNTAEIYGLFEPQIRNHSEAGLSWQFALNDMVAGSGWVQTLHFTNPANSGGMYDTLGSGASGSWVHRLSLTQYVGGIYQYSWAEANPVSASELGHSNTEGDNLLGFYTAYLQPRLSISVEGGGQHYTLKQAGFPNYSAWAPSGTASMSWQGEHTNFAVSYGHAIAAGEGALDAFNTNDAAVSGRWQLSRAWMANVDGSYSMLSNVAPQTYAGSVIGRGHMISGSAAVRYQISPVLQLTGNYARIHQSYQTIPSIKLNPDSDRVLFSLTYFLQRPLGR